MYFYDTNCLLNIGEKNLFKEKFFISSLTYKELENIKTSDRKDGEIKYKARKVIKLLNKHLNDFTIVQYDSRWDFWIKFYRLTDNMDSRVIISALKTAKKDKDLIFATADGACLGTAKGLKLNVELFNFDTEIEKYQGYKELYFNDFELANFYNTLLPQHINQYNLLENQYLIIYNCDKEVVDKYKWHNCKYDVVNYYSTESSYFGKIKPKDIYQQLAMESFKTNQLSVLRGSAGTGKSLLALSYLFQELERGRIDKIIMFVNPVATKDSCKFGFLPGDLVEKVLGSQIGNFLVSKLGGVEMVEKLVDDGQLVLIPTADARGYDTSGMNAGIYLTEGQNTTIDMMKLMVQRIGDDSICIIEGDDQTQVDVSSYDGANNGLRRLSQVFRGQDYYGEITLNNCYRSKIAERAELM